MSKTALITGVSGQDGSYLVELLLDKGYHVHGLVRRTSSFSRGRIEATRQTARDRGLTFELHYGNLTDPGSLFRVVSASQPDEVYNLASQSHVGVSFDEPEHSSDINGTGVLRLLECIRHLGLQTRFYQASSSELFGEATGTALREDTPFAPRSPYAISKLYAHWMCHSYRTSYGMHCSNGILFNHESPRRGENFVTRKITRALARIKAGRQERLMLGNMEARRDWGYARDFVEAMWLMLQQDTPEDYVIATGQTHSVRDFVDRAAAITGYDLEWDGEGVETKGIDRKTGGIIVGVDPHFYRPTDVAEARGDASKAREQLGWTPSVSFDELVEIMQTADLERVGASI